MRLRPRWLPLLVAALAGPLVLAACGSSTPSSTPTATASGVAGKPTAIVAMGDSYISGEAGRWAGNGSPMPTDRTCDPYPLGKCPGYDGAQQSNPALYAQWQAGIDKVYIPPSYQDMCDRSDTEEILTNAIAADQKINIACSGAVNNNIYPTAQGGQPEKGEAPQGDQLAQIAKNYDIKMIVLSTGGNDLGFASIVGTCMEDFELKKGDCQGSQEAAINSKMPVAQAGAEKAIDTTRGVMQAAGYPDGSYQLIYQTYLSPIAHAADNAVPETSAARLAAGCPMDNQDEAWATDVVVPQITNMQRQVAKNKSVPLLDLEQAGAGHQVCNKNAQQVTSNTQPVDPAKVEWFRAVELKQGRTREFMHPNSIMQRGFGKCLGLLYDKNAAGGSDNKCTNTPGQAWDGMQIG